MNGEIKSKAKMYGICLWQLAEALGIADTTLSKKLRRELPPEEKRRFFEVLEQIKENKEKKEELPPDKQSMVEKAILRVAARNDDQEVKNGQRH